MKTVTVIFACLFAMMCFSCQPSTNSSFSDEAAAKAEFDADAALAPWVEMWNSYDLDRVDELFLTGDRVTYLSSEKEGLIMGIEALREHHAGFGFVPGGKDQPNRLWVEDRHATVFGSAKIITGTWYFSRGEDGANPQRGPFTAAYVLNDNGENRIAHMHFANYEAAEAETDEDQ